MTAAHTSLRLTCVVDGFGIGGAERALLRFVQRLDPARYAVEVFSTGVEGPLMESFAAAGASVVSHPKRRKVDFALIGRLARRLRAHRADCVLSVLYYADVIAGLAARHTGVPVVSWQHVLPSRDIKNNRWYHRAAYRLAHPSFARVVCCADCVRDDLIRCYRLDPRKVVTIHNGVDTESFACAPPRAGAIDLHLGMVARFGPEKGHRTLLEALARMEESAAPIRLTLIGDGPTRPEMEAFVEQRGLNERVTFLGARDDVAALYPTFDAVVLPSDYEAHPMSMLEAMACGRPVIASDLPGTRETILHGVNGLLVPAGDAAAWSATLASLARDLAQCARMGTAARRRVEEAFTLDRQQQRLEAVIREATERRC